MTTTTNETGLSLLPDADGLAPSCGVALITMNTSQPIENNTLLNSYTPGPWFTQHSNHDAWGIWDSGNRLVAKTVGLNTLDQRMGSPSTVEANKANARLIAAAPELLQALMDAERHLSQSLAAITRANVPHFVIADCTGSRELVRNAIAKATGKEDQ